MAVSGGFGPARERVPQGLRRGTRALMVGFNVLYLCAAPVLWFFWTQRAAFRLPSWAENTAGFAAGPLAVLVLAAAWITAGILFARGRRQAGAAAFNTICALGALAAVSGMFVLVSAGLDR
ncbi:MULTISPECIES: hypothetical protein [unclassified Arthrobacter]|uniref:hypothetical protein n=1 Tax=unclassified Arthrobacter TaxID=235627 RepID=UPI001E3D65A2|nr:MULTISPECIES: hypothetical protein [unclassified Arthrobacter]MCC9144201.1 hypothetical protein [Arthrobacter sp. zg-Y919]MDK1275426.1 hypothetical protein [Arthrobacter sp. zg.Y919]WIB03192.1 hypothetical protein QNO10_00340 [Arthrobacter sp. zg-Y919]